METSPSSKAHSLIDGFDPLGSDLTAEGEIGGIFEEASRRIVHNILKSYTGYFDAFSELLQNSLDAVQIKTRSGEDGYQPKIWINIDVQSRTIRVVDNGCGMDEQEFKYCLRPNVSFKRQADLRGHKGVGATFLAYGFSFIKIQSKKQNSKISAILRQGRQWAEDTGGTIPRPKLQATPFEVQELANETSGTVIEIIVGQAPGERPKDLGWLGAQTAAQWFDVLRLKTPLGGIYLSGAPFAPALTVQVKSVEGTVTTCESARAEYYYPHEIPNLKGQSLGDIQKAMTLIKGDSATVFAKLDSEFKRLDCIYEIWDKNAILAEDSPFRAALDDATLQLIERHQVIVYGCFLRSAKLWTEFNDDILKLRKGQRVIHGGLQIASDYMPQGELSIIPLTSSIGYQANSHVIVHFTDGDPDMGRKTFQPELTELAQDLSVRVVNAMRRFLQHMKPDTGASSLTPDRELHEWKTTQEYYWQRSPLAFAYKGQTISLLSQPQQEQDVVALFHQLIGMGFLRGYKFYATSQSDRYDSLFQMNYEEKDGILFDVQSNKLGISRNYDLPYTTEPKVLEYKYSFDSLISDFAKEEKFAKQINFVVCWKTGNRFGERFYLQSLLIGDEGSSRNLYGSTHQAFATGSSDMAFEVLILEDLLNYVHNPLEEEARQKRLYRDS
jgi:hypothetical protein